MTGLSLLPITYAARILLTEDILRLTCSKRWGLDIKMRIACVDVHSVVSSNKWWHIQLVFIKRDGLSLSCRGWVLYSLALFALTSAWPTQIKPPQFSPSPLYRLPFWHWMKRSADKFTIYSWLDIILSCNTWEVHKVISVVYLGCTLYKWDRPQDMAGLGCGRERRGAVINTGG